MTYGSHEYQPSHENICDGCGKAIAANEPAEESNGFHGLRHQQCELPLEHPQNVPSRRQRHSPR